ncbi:MAG TPA: hypothetical protein VLS48_03130, partial [Anaerolineales bacterium]|nr:hypothetical protein [Anaerolineales bacterium]
MLFGLIKTNNDKKVSPTVDCRGNSRFTSRANGGQKELDRQLIELYEVSKIYRTAAGRFTAL